MMPIKWSAIFLTLAIIGVMIGLESNFIYFCLTLSNIWGAAYYLTKDKS